MDHAFPGRVLQVQDHKGKFARAGIAAVQCVAEAHQHNEKANAHCRMPTDGTTI
jgi:hypothetical protein